eukprot:TRINITY_DN61738_c0_g1_i1.p1 TRINITY_DN61738_c0_g1~~TRINITY_DN61738_c0_g1_i1.p1  ORF type:complete len:212 (-),score=43.64 TRINITY_DN61738_c0_g1_i1:38-673(-)
MADIEQVRSIQDMFIEELETEAKSKDKVVLILEDLESESEAEDEEEQARTSEPSLEDLRKKAVLFVSKECSDESDRVSQRIQLEGAPGGFQNTGTSYTMYKVLDSELRKAKGNFNSLLTLTVAFKDEDYCFHDTDIPDVAKKLVSRWAKLWQDALSHGLPLDERSVEGVMYMLSKLKGSSRRKWILIIALPSSPSGSRRSRMDQLPHQSVS